MERRPNAREMSRAFAAKDASYDGVFYVAVRTTGVFCRPSCRARRPNPRNVEYFHAIREALRAGYRPCKRCHPLDTDGRAPAWVRLLIEGADRPERLRDRDLRAMGVEPARARRFFKAHYRMTFQAYDRARRMGRAMTSIRKGRGVLEAAMDQGYKSDSGFRDAFARTFKTTPGRGRQAECIVTAEIESPIGSLLAGATSEAVCLLEFGSERRRAGIIASVGGRFGCEVVPGENEHIRQLRKELGEYFAGKRTRFEVPLAYPGTAFQVAVWKRLLKIPYGRTVSYERIAKEIGKPAAQRAVGMANHNNRIAIVIPCHRVLNKDGKLGGYGGGLWRKQFLLDLEGKQGDKQ